MTPEVAILMPVLNAERTLPAALTSIRAQTFSDWELLIVDDGSEDRSAQIAAETAAADPRIRVMPGGGRHGLSVQLNRLLDVARSPLFARMDADDISYPQRLDRQVAYLRDHPQVDLVGAAMIVFGADGLAIGKRAAPLEHREICARSLAGFRLFHPTWLGRAEWFRRHRYSEQALRCEDQELLYRSHHTSVFANIDKPLLGYREEKLILRNLLAGRLNWTRTIGGRLWRDGHRRHALQVTVGQSARASVDAISIGTGLGHRLLPQRAGRMSLREMKEWRGVWESFDPALSSNSRQSAWVDRDDV
jgi:glycosyltransferase involved in cell wall biosynthesis